jgi:hypothetical protein
MIARSADQQRRNVHELGGNDMKTLHSFKEFGWVAFWVAATVFLFAVFIPTINRSLNL